MNKDYPNARRMVGLALAAIALTWTSCQTDPHTARLEEAMDSFQIEEGMEIELVAAEPLVIDPVALAFDENRRMYVVEDRGYPDPPEGGTPTHLGRVALLEDTDGDGTYDKRSEFAEGLTYPNGVLPWKGGVFVTCAPDIYYFKDTDGDGVADIKKVVLTGFSDTRTAQIRMSHPTLGLDGWVYVTGGLNGGNITSPDHPERPAVSYTSADGRFNPETFEFQVTGGKSQFGLAFDAYGHRFGTSNRHPVMQSVMEPWYLRRNPHLLFNETVENVSKVEADAVVFPISEAVTTADYIPRLIGRSHAGTFTAASGPIVFNGTGLTPDHQGNVFICESAQNLVQRQVMHPEGVSFQSEIAEEGKEFLASTDVWFRPVFLQHGPEGGLYIADMHRKVIDHPSYVPEEARGKLDFESGKTDGRIYRVVREGFKEEASQHAGKVDSSATVEDLVKALTSPEEWDRNTAHRLLLERKDPATADLIKATALQAERPETRARALWLLHSLGALDAGIIKTALSDKEAGVREQAVRLIEDLSAKYPDLQQDLIAAADDESMRVRFNVALVLGSLDGPEVIDALAKIAARDGADKWVRAAVLSGIGERMPAFLTAFREQQKAEPKAFASVMQDLGRLFGNGGSVQDCRVILQDVVSSDGSPDWRISTALGLMEGVTSRAKEFGSSPKGLLYAIQGNTSAANRAAMDNFVNTVAALAEDTGKDKTLRVHATALLGYTNFEHSNAVLQKLLDARNPPEIQLEAVNALGKLNDPRGAALLTEKSKWSSYSPQVKPAVIAALVSKPTFIDALFSAIENGTVAAAEISSVDRVRLMKSKDKKVSEKANVLFEELEGGDRMKVYQEYRKILEDPSDAKLGKVVFQQTCSPCHTYDGEGGKVGPDLTGVKNQPADALLLHILVPNYEVLPAYQSISVTTNDGGSFSGWLVSETENSLTLRTAFGTDEAILRSNIASLTNSGLSLMPDGLEHGMSKEDMANLIAFLKQGGGE